MTPRIQFCTPTIVLQLTAVEGEAEASLKVEVPRLTVPKAKAMLADNLSFEDAVNWVFDNAVSYSDVPFAEGTAQDFTTAEITAALREQLSWQQAAFGGLVNYLSQMPQVHRESDEKHQTAGGLGD